MLNDPKSSHRFNDKPSDKPVSERTEHANLERPGAQAHPSARGWQQPHDPVMAWRTR